LPITATDGDLHRAPIYADLYQPLGVADELRAAFVVGTTCWGVASFLRATDDGPFPDHEIAQVRALTPFIARALKTAACKLDAAALGPGSMIVLDAANRVESRTAGAGELLADLHTGGMEEPGLPTIVGAVATRARSHHSSTQIATRMRGASGRWRRVTAAPMEDDNQRVAVVIEPARPGDLVPILLESYGLTPREVEIVILLARGLATKEIAAELSLSSHTVRDHIKAIYEKTCVNSRSELVARLFSEHMLDSFHAETVHRTG
jgi:DNA-binding CsgD family transcriptional regulator